MEHDNKHKIKCAYCGAPNSIEVGLCSQCGAVLVLPEDSPNPPVLTPEPVLEAREQAATAPPPMEAQSQAVEHQPVTDNLLLIKDVRSVEQAVFDAALSKDWKGKIKVELGEFRHIHSNYDWKDYFLNISQVWVNLYQGTTQGSQEKPTIQKKVGLAGEIVMGQLVGMRFTLEAKAHYKAGILSQDERRDNLNNYLAELLRLVPEFTVLSEAGDMGDMCRFEYKGIIFELGSVEEIDFIWNLEFRMSHVSAVPVGPQFTLHDTALIFQEAYILTLRALNSSGEERAFRQSKLDLARKQ